MVYVSEEAENHSQSSVWVSTFATIISKFFFALTFAVPVLLLGLDWAVVVSIAWGLLLIGIFSWRVAMHRKEKPYKVIGEHVLITLAVIALTHFVGDFVATLG